jgi:FixJ family two-component response regulator
MFQSIDNPCLPDEPRVLLVGCEVAESRLLKSVLRALEVDVESCSSMEAFLDAWEPCRRGCVFLNLDQAGVEPREVIRRLAEHWVYLPVVLLAPHVGKDRDVAEAARAVRGGAFDYIPRPWLPERLIEAAGESLQWEAEHHAAIARRECFDRRLTRLDEKEREVLAMMVEGMPSQAIASLLGLAARTVENRRLSMMKKLRSKGLADLLRNAIVAGVGGRSLAAGRVPAVAAE